MRINQRQAGLSLMEEALVVAIVAVLLAIALPSLKHLFNTMQTPAGVRAMIGSALASARAMAAKEQQYVGVRFQHTCYIDPKGIIQPGQSPLRMPQYMIFVKYQPPKQTGSNDEDTFNAVEGIEPIKLPVNIGVMDLLLTPTVGNTKAVSNNADIDTDDELLDTTTFSIVFSPSGKLVVRTVLARNRDGETSLNTSEDDVFNTWGQVQSGVARFIQDNSPVGAGSYLREEPSRRSFIIYDRSELRSLPPNGRYRLSGGQPGYLEDLKNREMIYINPYTGTFIDK